MSDQKNSNFAEDVLRQYLGTEPAGLNCKQLSGGCINEAFKITCHDGNFFLKYNKVDFKVQFLKEARALNMLRDTQTLTTPEVLQIDVQKDKAFFLMEYIQPGQPGPDFWRHFGQQLAELHRTTSENHQFGLSFDNYIGKLPQKNAHEENWIDFFIQHRLEIQINLAFRNRLITGDFLRRFQKLYGQLPGLLPFEPPSLIHGDLWSGNFLCGSDGRAVLIDPAVYFGNREVELAFTRLFGGFAPDFYDSYEEAWPLQPGFAERVEIYNLYPLLVHVNLFGTSYLSGIEQIIQRYT